MKINEAPTGEDIPPVIPPVPDPGPMRFRSRAWEIAGVYAVAGLLWIFFSDQVLALMVSDPGRLVALSTYKGYAFVAVTAVIMLILLTRAFGVIGQSYASLQMTEQLLRDAYATLEQKVEERTVELQAALVRAESADHIKSAFLATMSHELRTPLNSIIGFTGIMLQGLAGPLNPEQTKQLEMVRGSGRHLLKLVNDILDISKIESGRLEVSRESFDVERSINRVLAMVKPQIDAKGLVLEASVPTGLGRAVNDEHRFEQVLLNLLGNAVKFTEHGRIGVTAERIEDHRVSDGGEGRPAIRIRISDSGIGIKPEDLITLFQPFRQIDSGLGRVHEGTGLGLAICRRLADLMDGEIHAESEWRKGSVFSFVLPLEGSVRA